MIWRRMTSRTFGLPWLMIAAVAGCGSGNTGGDGGGGGGNYFKATVDGRSFNATQTGASLDGGDVGVAGQITTGNTVEQINIYLFGVTGPGTFAIAAQPLNFANITQTTNNTTLSWTSSNEGATGSVTVSSLTTTHISGSFAFTAPAVIHTGATGTRQISSGTFSVDFNQ